MSIRWDSLLTRYVAAELARSLSGCRLRAVRLDRAERDLTLLFRERTLIWRLHPERGDLRLHAAVEPTAGDHRLKGRVEGVVAPPDERLVRFEFSGGTTGPVSVVVELMSTQWNAFVIHGDPGVVRHQLWHPQRETRDVIGQPYEPPAPTGRLGVDGDVALDAWLEALEPLPAGERARALVRRFAWTSPLNAAAISGESTERAAGSDLEAGFALWRSLADPATPAEPVVLEGAKGLQPYPVRLPGATQRPVGTLLEAFAACATEGDEAGATSAAAVLGAELLERLQGKLGHAERRVRRLEAELEGLPDPQRMRAVGDLILARYKDIPSGSVATTLIGFEGEPVEVSLDPAAPAHANAAAYYQRATKAERAAERLPALIDEASVAYARLETLTERVRTGEADETEVRAALGPATPRSGGGDAAPSLPYRSYRSSGGLEIRVGRGARHNDDLTFHHSAPDDVWLHARQAAGAHVVLRWPGPGRPPARDLREAAVLAALHSKARTSGSVPVDWTLRKYVRKPRKAPRGQVAVERVETLFVEPDATLLDSLRDRGGLE
jgi:predicted ribosome quality control (RQC) complex YloA/Tae2 family protein